MAPPRPRASSVRTTNADNESTIRLELCPLTDHSICIHQRTQFSRGSSPPTPPPSAASTHYPTQTRGVASCWRAVLATPNVRGHGDCAPSKADGTQSSEGGGGGGGFRHNTSDIMSATSPHTCEQCTERPPRRNFVGTTVQPYAINGHDLENKSSSSRANPSSDPRMPHT